MGISIFEPFAVVAKACEKLNSFAVELTKRKVFLNTTTCTDLRYYEDGWKFEKYIEAPINKMEGYTAAWALELSDENGKWKIRGNVSISYSDYDEDIFTDVICENDLEDGLNRAIQVMIASYQTGHSFRNEIDRLLLDAQDVNP